MLFVRPGETMDAVHAEKAKIRANEMRSSIWKMIAIVSGRSTTTIPDEQKINDLRDECKKK